MSVLDHLTAVSPSDDPAARNRLTPVNGLALISLPSDNKSDGGGQRGVTLSGSALMENSGVAAAGAYCVQRPSTIRSRGSGDAASDFTSRSTLVASPPDNSCPRICLDFYAVRSKS